VWRKAIIVVIMMTLPTVTRAGHELHNPAPPRKRNRCAMAEAKGANGPYDATLTSAGYVKTTASTVKTGMNCRTYGQSE
jgi:hypothetical protein